eukprot:scaffold10092_cov123-Amphora_coffeaeformis.AAC.2
MLTHPLLMCHHFNSSNSDYIRNLRSYRNAYAPPLSKEIVLTRPLWESSRKKIGICVDTVLSLPPCFRSTRKGEEGRFVQGPGRVFVYQEEEVLCGRGKSFEGTSSGRWFVRLVQLRVAWCGHVET